MSHLTRVVCYARVSTLGQAEGGVSLDAQVAKLRAFAEATDLEVVDVILDAGASAKTLDRPGLQRALAMLNGGEADGVLVTKLDRLTRSVRDLGDLVDRYFSSKFALLSVADSIDTRSASGRLVLHILGSVSQWERESTGERTKEALREVKRQGGRVGAVGLGLRRIEHRDGDGRLVVEVAPEERAIVERIVGLRREGLAYHAIADILTREQIPTKRGGRWFAATVRGVALREKVGAVALTP
uniref:recombinase family protein n=1 Tax=Gemmatimonas sp. TaxID=1962908 RepID=UPI003983C2EA